MGRYQVFSKWFAGEIMKKCRALKFVFLFCTAFKKDILMVCSKFGKLVPL